MRGLKILTEWLKSPKFAEASKKLLTKDEAYKLGHYLARLLSTTNHPEKIAPLIIKQNYKFSNPVQTGESYINLPVSRELRFSPTAGTSTLIHEGAHQSTLNANPLHPSIRFTLNNFYPVELRSAAEKQMLNAKKLADLLVVDQEKVKKRVLKDVLFNGKTQEKAKKDINEYIAYLKKPQEARARAITRNLYQGQEHPAVLDAGVNYFTDRSLNNLYKNIFIVPTALGFGALAVALE